MPRTTFPIALLCAIISMAGCRMSLPARHFAIVTDTINCRAGWSPGLRLAKLGDTPHYSQPFVQQKNQPRVPVAAIAVRPDSIVTDRGSFALNDVTAYGNGAATWATAGFSCTGKPVFLRELMVGKICIYGATFHWQGSIRGHLQEFYRRSYFVQRQGTDAILPFTYGSLSGMILPGDPGYNYLLRYRKTQYWGYRCMWGGLAVGYLASLTGGNSNKVTPGQVIGASVAMIGIGCFFTSATFLLRNSRNLQKAIAACNHFIE